MISVIIPIYNAERILEAAIKALTEYLSAKGMDHEILLRDDGSRDSSRRLMDDISRRYGQVRSFHNEKNMGLGYTLQKLFGESKGDIIFYSDCDLPFGCDVIGKCGAALQTADVVVASRYMGEANQAALSRKIMSRLYHLLCTMLFDVPVVDLGSGAVMLRKKAIEGLEIASRGFGVHIELFVRARQRGAVIREIPAPTQGKGTSTFSILRHGPGIVLETLQFFIRSKNV